MSDNLTKTKTIRMSLKEAVFRVGRSDTTIYSYCEKKAHEGWNREIINGLSYIDVPVSYIKDSDGFQEVQPVFQSVTNPLGASDDSSSKSYQPIPQEVTKILEVQTQLLERLTKQDEERERLNRQLENTQNQLVKYREQDKKIEDLTQQVSTLATLVTELTNELRKKEAELSQPWWKKIFS